MNLQYSSLIPCFVKLLFFLNLQTIDLKLYFIPSNTVILTVCSYTSTFIKRTNIAKNIITDLRIFFKYQIYAQAEM